MLMRLTSFEKNYLLNKYQIRRQRKLKKIKVGAVTYVVIEKPFIDIDGNRNHVGCCDYDHTEITILADLSEGRKKATFYHKLMHAIFKESGFDDQDEDMVNRLGIVLQQVIEENFQR